MIFTKQNQIFSFVKLGKLYSKYITSSLLIDDILKKIMLKTKASN